MYVCVGEQCVCKAYKQEKGKKATEKTLTLCSSVTKKNIYMVGNEMMKSNRTFLSFLNCVYSSIMIRLKLFFYPCDRNNGAAERGRREGRRAKKNGEKRSLEMNGRRTLWILLFRPVCTTPCGVKRHLCARKKSTMATCQLLQ